MEVESEYNSHHKSLHEPSALCAHAQVCDVRRQGHANGEVRHMLHITFFEKLQCSVLCPGKFSLMLF